MNSVNNRPIKTTSATKPRTKPDSELVIPPDMLKAQEIQPVLFVFNLCDFDKLLKSRAERSKLDRKDITISTRITQP